MSIVTKFIIILLMSNCNEFNLIKIVIYLLIFKERENVLRVILNMWMKLIALKVGWHFGSIGKSTMSTQNNIEITKTKIILFQHS